MKTSCIVASSQAGQWAGNEATCIGDATFQGYQINELNYKDSDLSVLPAMCSRVSNDSNQ